jgi:magnesium chelatase family protein
MHGKVFSCAIDGVSPKIIEVETDIQNGMPVFTIVGLGDASVQESKERVRSALKNCKAQFPPLRKTVNLSPANIRKHGPSFDFPIAVSVLAASSQIPKEILEESLFVGELTLNSELREIRGALPIVQHAKIKGFKRVFLPYTNAKEGSYVEGIKVYGVKNLKELIDFLYSGKGMEPCSVNEKKFSSQESIYDMEFIYGRSREKRILEIAAAGRLNFLMYGPPGSGKTLLARTFQTILPPLQKEDSLELTSIYSIAGMIDLLHPIIYKSPFREVHHTATQIAILGGGVQTKAGEVTLAHKGAIFFDELSEFSNKILDSLRKPLEDGYINIQRAKTSIILPTDVIFIGAMNPCPCGFYGDKERACKCTSGQIQRHNKKLSGPFLDRIDMVFPVTRKNISDRTGRESSEQIAKRVESALKIQLKRQGKENKKLKGSEIKRHCKLDKKSKSVLHEAIFRLKISTRGTLQILKIARTIADLAQSADIKFEHLTEALQYRSSLS